MYVYKYMYQVYLYTWYIHTYLFADVYRYIWKNNVFLTPNDIPKNIIFYCNRVFTHFIANEFHDMILQPKTVRKKIKNDRS